MRYVLLVVLAVTAIGFICEQDVYEGFLPDQEETETEIVLVIDKSGSMRGARLEEAKRAATSFVESLVAGQRVGVVAFDDRAQIVHSMSANQDSLVRAIEDIRVGFWTSYLPALAAAQDLFTSSQNRNIIIFLSDGVDEEPERVFEAQIGIVQEGTCIFTVAYAADEGADVLLGGMAEQSLHATGCGAFFEAQENGFDLEYVYSTLHRDITGEEVLEVRTRIQEGTAEVAATYRVEDIFTATCLAPSLTFTVWDGERIVLREQATAPSIQFDLPAGTYRYETIVHERCQGACFVYGRDYGTFTVGDVCAFTEQEYFLLTHPDVVRITPEGFLPRTMGTAGTVIWVNEDTRPRRVRSATDAWESPLLEPQENWSKAFSEGVHGYTDEEGTFTGTIRTTRATDPSQFVFVFDNSGSMAGERLQVAKDAATSFVDLLSPQDRASFIVFDQRVRLLQDAQTTDKNRLKASIQGIRAEGYSLYIPALRLAGEQLRSPVSRTPVVIFLSDGLPRDPEGIEGILDAIDTYIPRACLTVIAYITEDVQAREVLERMAAHAYQTSQCGAFYTVFSDDEDLRAVLGEIYVASQQDLLEFVDTSVERTRSHVTIATRVRAIQTRIFLPNTQGTCLPEARVRALVGVEQHPLEFNGTHYVTTITRTNQPMRLVASITAEGTAQTATGHAEIPGTMPLPYRWFFVVGVGLVLILLSRTLIKPR